MAALLLDLAFLPECIELRGGGDVEATVYYSSNQRLSE
jgi:hypothetical protein